MTARGQMGCLRIRYPVVASTMDVAMALAASGAPHGVVVEAGYQTAGRGRQGRAWRTSADSALLSSWILRPPPGRNLSVLSPLVALALIRTVESLIPDAPIAYKWPNDVLIGGGKVAGVLLTARGGGVAPVVVAGVGVNVGPGSVPSGERGTLLTEWCKDITVDALRCRLGQELGRIWSDFMIENSLSDTDLADLQRRLAWADVEVAVRLPQAEIVGVQTGITHDGGLILNRSSDGGTIVLHAGEIVRGPRIAKQNGP